ncbi:sensor histidine kinase [Qaidamihabitans albus]|uniref:sensor histidine kinase n=1 Tax=Qaidamihabitans albus TaxID=2795733 RepID=UPI0018F1FF62|nr:histidine kinase [Qaidamihabitans albus]
MGRHLPAAVVVLVTGAALLVAGATGPSWWQIAGYALAVALVIVLRYRSTTAALVAGLVLASVSGIAFVLLLWIAYQAGRDIKSRSDLATVAGAAAGYLAVQFITGPPGLQGLPSVVATFAVFVAGPLLVGRYLAQHERLVTTLGRHNAQLRRERELLAERERLRERLRIARDLHDSLGRRLNLVSVQAAALEVLALPPQRQAARAVNDAARGAVHDLYELVGTLRGENAEHEPSPPGLEAVGGLVAEFREAGVPVTLHRRGAVRPLSAAAGQAAYRVVEETLNNAAKHAPGRPVTVRVQWEDDALLLTVVNPVPDGRTGTGAGYGLSGLGERLGPLGGFLDYGPSDEGFRVTAMLPADTGETGEVTDEASPPSLGRVRTTAVGLATAAVTFAVLPASLVVGAG